ncbi:carbon-monoxide dehydrogenase medium subunit [Sinorhizobium fredii]|uniref:Molybdopterin dehydrogenase FAD-binding protein n=1 Tax=Sinorhizobium fredii (strain USDA 257) TaxID=1185652 RepID=I3X5A7_SINF2|nr:FAD binding domain-containing protein [Sinorhizobium fredii]AFL51063.1 molybdopterin dehydrogenase FAD-binding protein [Sinorhizobium fredii USDA 257]
MPGIAEQRLILAETIEQAREALRQGRAVLAGGTWLMRAPVRGQVMPERLVSVGRIAALNRVGAEAEEYVIGAAVTHVALVEALRNVQQLAGLVAAAVSSANPAVRRVATLGGNLCCVDFAASDFAPALLACGAHVELETAQGAATLPMSEFLARRAELLSQALLTGVRVPRSVERSAHQRLPMRKAGDYPVAIVSMAICDGELRIAVGSVEPVARRWTALEQALHGQKLTPELAAELAATLNDFRGRDGIEAVGWYRREVLPALVRRCTAALLSGESK